VIILRKNKLRDLIREDKPTIGTHVLCPWPGIVEVVASTNSVDYVEFVGEYAPFDLHDLENISRACELYGISSMMKIDQQPRTFLAQRALGSGIQNLLFADIRNVEDVEECIRAVKMETPDDKGVHGCHMRRSVGYILDVGSKQYLKAMNDTVIVIMIEKKSAIDNLEEILSVKGVDMIQFGPCDYSISIGVPGEFNHPKVKEAELKAIKTALKMKVRPRVELEWGFTERSLQQYIDLGVRDFCNGTDVSIVYNWVKENTHRVRSFVK
jgi:4-hydroxy-2-oxoheptanedioate aldolase